ncbi:choice-of-anchor D domain-containing protein [Flavobacterium sp. '19STA2R22 D10 B1']|uniref:choice-of-anchor D domain-containing protein n=1 Tax=Flavobacterium aerium TaxID=3037261 RepID=UPI00278BD1DC|nr:choice-of-anchor D domain-containing protein [Flavobacterium sp. '19STA2R22 D10 B1']
MFKKRFFLALVLSSIAGISFGKEKLSSDLGKTVVNSPIAHKTGKVTVDQSLWSNMHNATISPLFAKALDCAGGGTESFTNMGSSTNVYSTRTWNGDNGVAWSASDARTDQTLTGRAITLRTGTLKNTSVVAGGIGTLTFNYKRVFSGNSTLKVFVNGVQYGGDITVSSDTSTSVFSQAINVAGNVNIEIRNSGNRTIVDDISWNCYSTATGPELQLVDSSNTNRPCGDFTLDFNAHPVSSNSDAIFTIKNVGTTALAVNALTLSNTTDFTIVSPSAPLSLAPSASTIVLVRFNSATAGAKTSTLTIESNDVDEASCVVALKGTALVPCVAPSTAEGDFFLDNITATSVDASTTGIVAGGYLAVITTASALTASPVNVTNYAVGEILGGGTVVYNGTAANFSLTGLTPSTAYNLFVFPYNTTDCSGGPLYNSAEPVAASFSTPVAPCIGASESFTNLGSNSSTYTTISWTGDNGVAWTSTDSRTDQVLTGKAITLRTGTLKNTNPIAGGIGTLSFNYKRVFNGDSTLKVFVNGVQYGGDITVTSDSTAVYSQGIDLAGPVTIEIKNSGNRTIIDDLKWGCYEIPNRPELQLVDSNLAQKACGAFTIDFGNVVANTNSDVTFSIENKGAQNLDVTALTVTGATSFTIVSPAAPFTVASLASQNVVVRFNNATPGVQSATLKIESNDADEASCEVSLKANILDNCVAPAGTATVTSTNVTSTSADVQITNITAGGYLAVISTSALTTNPSNGTVYVAGAAFGSGTVAYVGTNSTFSLSNLNPSTTYILTVYAYNSGDCIGGPAYTKNSTSAQIVTLVAPCVGGSETFTNLGSSSNAYITRVWTGDNGVAWSATDARADQVLTGKAITLRTGTLTNTTPVAGGIGTLTFNYQRVFTDNSVLKVYVNDVQYGGDIVVSSTATSVYSQAINVTGNVTIKIVNTGNRTIIDDLSWNCNSSSARPSSLDLGNVVENSNNEVKLYPNPNHGQFQVGFSANENADIMVYDSLGKNILSKNVSSQETIDLGNAPKGIYMVVIKTGNTVSTKKIIVN